MLSKCFKCLSVNEYGIWMSLEMFPNLTITTSPIDSSSALQLSATLPCYSLSFFVNEREERESHDFKDMVYNDNQSVGTLFGLENLLVLRPKTRFAGTLVPDDLIPRRILIPNG